MYLRNQTKKNKYTVEDNTFKRVVKDYDPDRIEVEVGDALQPDFKPQFKLKRWDNEVNFSMRAEEDPTATVETDGEKIKYVTPEYEVHQYDKPDASEEGGFEFEWVLPKKPKSNVLRATIQTKELNFFYQPELTKKEKERGMERPENVIGSYAVYHKSKRDNRVGGKEYKTGKAFHIYRPKAIDAKGKEVWCKLNIDVKKGFLTVTVPQEFLNKAKYPVVVDPSFGYTTAGGTTGTIARSNLEYRRGSFFTSPSGGTLDNLKAYIGSYESSELFNVKGLVNERDSNGSNSHDQIATAEVTNQSGDGSTGAPSWKTFTLNNEAITQDNDYILSVIGEKNTNFVIGSHIYLDRVVFDGSNSNEYSEGYFGGGEYASPEDPWGVALTDMSVYDTWTLDNFYYEYDFVVKSGSFPKHLYEALQDHTASASDEPGVGVNWESYWTDYGDLAFSKYSIYATYTEPTTSINIGDTWKELDTAQINIGDSWKDVVEMQINIGDVWKTAFELGIGKMKIGSTFIIK